MSFTEGSLPCSSSASSSLFAPGSLSDFFLAGAAGSSAAGSSAAGSSAAGSSAAGSS